MRTKRRSLGLGSALLSATLTAAPGSTTLAAEIATHQASSPEFQQLPRDLPDAQFGKAAAVCGQAILTAVGPTAFSKGLKGLGLPKEANIIKISQKGNTGIEIIAQRSDRESISTDLDTFEAARFVTRLATLVPATSLFGKIGTPALYCLQAAWYIDQQFGIKAGTWLRMAIQEHNRPAITRWTTRRKGVLVYLSVHFTDPGKNAEGFGFKGDKGSGWAEENHPFSHPSYGRVSNRKVTYPFNHACDTAKQRESDVKFWIYTKSGARSHPVVAHLKCANRTVEVFSP
ncbi:hypothetical protein OG195_45030 (plasmid) [Streptomyces sp. NBC_01362]|uniref:hypothetical protein n=1 Tax=Streptomyces sp. NBC_01362 TaxID=2903839 RepID=UPI002E2EFF18|nr:hypothetical protein [Streptomyces sp. NBC_01362]